jgi:protein involved in polysaccharide export with SLBB domain
MFAKSPIFQLAWVLVATGMAANAGAAQQDSLGTETGIAGAQAPRSPVRDTIVQLRERLELAHLRDSLSRILSSGKPADTEPSHPAREFLKSADTSLFASHAGAIGADYPLGPGDAISLSIWGQKQARYDLEIDRDGMVSIPSVGQVSLNGATFGEAKTLIARRLGVSYSGLQSGLTQIDLTLLKLKQVRVFVVGDVVHPGGYLLSGNTTCLQAVALAGGPDGRGSERIVRISRGETTLDVDLYRYFFLGRRPAGDVLRDGDVVQVVPSQGTALASGAFSRPGYYEILPGETVADLVAFAGGVGPTGAPDQPLRLTRTQGEERTTVQVGLPKDLARTGKSFPVSAGDALFASSRADTRRTSPIVTGFVQHPGTYPWESSLTLRKAVALAGGPSRGAFADRVLVVRSDSAGSTSLVSGSLESGPDLPLLPTDSVVVGGVAAKDSAIQVRIGGAVRSPGTYDWHRGMRLGDLLLVAGGAEPWADLSSVRLDEKNGAGLEAKSRVVHADSSRTEASDPVLAPYSVVSVPRRGIPEVPGLVAVTGRVRNPGYQSLRSGKDRISSVLQRAGGPDSASYIEGAYVWRRSEGRIPANLARALAKPGSANDIVLRPGDSIDVPERPATVLVTGLVNRPARVLWQKGKGWEWYVRSAGDFSDSASREAVYVQYADGSIQSLSMGPDDPTPGSTVVVPRKDPPRPTSAVEKISAAATVVTALSAILTAVALYMNFRK